MGEIEIKQNMNHNENSEKMNQITMLGTGNATVSQIYNTCFLLKTSSTLMLVDAGGGNGILSQLHQANNLLSHTESLRSYFRYPYISPFDKYCLMLFIQNLSNRG